MNEMENRKIIIDYTEYRRLLEAEVKVNAIKNLAEADKNEYGYGSDTSKSINALLGIGKK